MSLMTTRRFAPLFWCQFFSALNDNFLKNSLVFLIMFKIGAEEGKSLIMVATAVLMAPYFFLSGRGGEFADRYDRGMVATRLKLVELAGAGLAAAGFAFHSVELLFLALFLFQWDSHNTARQRSTLLAALAWVPYAATLFVR